MTHENKKQKTTEPVDCDYLLVRTREPANEGVRESTVVFPYISVDGKVPERKILSLKWLNHGSGWLNLNWPDSAFYYGADVEAHEGGSERRRHKGQ